MFNRADFERKTVKSVLNEINKVSNIILSFKKNYKHGKVQNYEFTLINKETIKTKNTKKQISIYDLEKENQIKHNSISQKQVKQLLNNIDKDNEVVFDNCFFK